MSVFERVADLQYWAFDHARHRRAADAAGKAGTQAGFDSLQGARQCLVCSFKRSGEAVPTPVNFGMSDDGQRLFFRSEARSAKIRRIRSDPHVRICACNMRGKPKGPVVEATARALAPSESVEAIRAVESNWTAAMKPVERGLERLPLDLVYVEVRPAGVDVG